MSQNNIFETRIVSPQKWVGKSKDSLQEMNMEMGVLSME